MEFSDILDITGKDIAQLNDTDLRELIGLLCEADFNIQGLCTSGIEWGGAQEASDGGIDVIVRSCPPSTSFVPRKLTVFQVKKHSIGPAKILKEMKPKGELRSIIMEAIQNHGSYIIVSSGSNVATPRKQERIDKMKKAVILQNNCDNLHLDFFDQGKIASWVRRYKSLMIWVRNKIGRPLIGWEPYGNWSHSPKGLDEAYIFDENLKIKHHPTLVQQCNEENTPLTIKEGIERLRNALSVPKNSIRLIGLSGVGKTRLMQTLFDEKIGNNSLHPRVAIYTNMSRAPQPDPKELLKIFIAEKNHVVLIIDNCADALHKELSSEIKNQNNQTVSLLTVEYDIQNDLSESTDVWKLEPASKEAIEGVLKNRFENLSCSNIEVITKLSEGNFRLALLLADAVPKTGTLSNFKNDEFFQRLFYQNRGKDNELLESSEVLSLLYSFNGEDTSEGSELYFLAKLVDESPKKMYRHIVELTRRQIVQSRSNWRAILPPAIANWLAKNALSSIPVGTIDLIQSNGSERIIKSFSHRLGYLHDSKEAIEIVNKWLSKEGWLGRKMHGLNKNEIEILRYIAPTSPGALLEAIEGLVLKEEYTPSDYAYDFSDLLTHVAYESSLFTRSVTIIVKLCIYEEKNKNKHAIRELLGSLFYINYSGTHASLEIRSAFVSSLINSENPDFQHLGIYLLENSLQASYSPRSRSNFGVRPRDLGYMAKSLADITDWYEKFFQICKEVLISSENTIISIKAKELLAKCIRHLWGLIPDCIEKSLKEVLEKQYFGEAWTVVASMINENIQDEGLNFLEKLLSPKTFSQEIEAWVLNDDGYYSHMSESEIKAREIGRKLILENDLLEEYLPKIMMIGTEVAFQFGRGLAEGTENKYETWHMLSDLFKSLSHPNLQVIVLTGFIYFCFERDLRVCESILDEVLNDSILNQYLFTLHCRFPQLTDRGLERIRKWLDLPTANLKLLYLQFPSWIEIVPEDGFLNLVEKIFSKTNTPKICLMFLYWRFCQSQKDSDISDRSIIFIRRMLLLYEFDEARDPCENRFVLANIIKISLKDVESMRIFYEKLCNVIIKAVNRKGAGLIEQNIEHVLAILSAHPKKFLTNFISKKTTEINFLMRIFRNDFSPIKSPLSTISDNLFIEWCDEDPIARYPLIVLAIPIYFFKATSTSELNKLAWNPIIYIIFQKAPDILEVLNSLFHVGNVEYWSGLPSYELKRRLVLFEELYENSNIQIVKWAREQHKILLDYINEIQRHQSTQRYLTFES